MKKTHHCGELNENDVRKSVRLIGWINSIRDHGGLFFVDLRDREGITQLVFDPKNPELSAINTLRDESVIEVEGEVTLRPQETINCKLKTGKVEVVVKKLIVHNICEVLPFPLEDNKADAVGEDLRLTYRYLDLRRSKKAPEV